MSERYHDEQKNMSTKRLNILRVSRFSEFGGKFRINQTKQEKFNHKNFLHHSFIKPTKQLRKYF